MNHYVDIISNFTFRVVTPRAEKVQSSEYTQGSNAKATKRQMRRRRDLPAIYQRDQARPCTSATSSSIISGAKAVDFAAFAAGILTLVLNVNNNINNNNNNNNNLNINAVDSSNIVANFNTNNANQVQCGCKYLPRLCLHIVYICAVISNTSLRSTSCPRGARGGP